LLIKLVIFNGYRKLLLHPTQMNKQLSSRATLSESEGERGDPDLVNLTIQFFQFLVFLLFFSISPAWAEEVMLLPDVVVEGGGSKEDAATKSQIKGRDYHERFVTVTEVLKHEPGIHLTRFGGLEESSSLSIRGSNADEVMVTLDGIPLNSADGSSVALAPFLMDGIETIEIYRGSAPLETGVAPSGGLVALKTSALEEGLSFSGGLGYGSFNTVNFSQHFNHKKGNWGFLAGVGYHRTSGDFDFLDDNGTPLNLADDQRVERQNNQSQTLHPFFKIAHTLDAKTQLEFLHHFLFQNRGVPGLSTNQAVDTSLTSKQWLSALKVKRDDFLISKLSFENLLYGRFFKEQFDDHNAEIGLGAGQDTNNETLLFGNKLAFSYSLNSVNRLSAFMSYQGEKFTPTDYLATTDGGSSSFRHQWNMGVGDEWDVWNRRLRFSPAVWLENVFNHLFDDDPAFSVAVPSENNVIHHNVSMRLGIQAKLMEHLNLLAHASSTRRYPNFYELFGDRGNVVGNPYLDPQKTIQWDVGFCFLFPEWSWLNEGYFEATYFDKRLNDLIQFEQSGAFARAENVGKASINGFELSGKWDLLKRISFKAGYTFQWAKDRGDNLGLFLAGKPKSEFSGELSYLIKPVRIFVEGNFMDENYLDPLNTRVVLARLVLNSGVIWTISSHWALSVEGKNLTNDQIVDVVGFPLPGREYFGRLTWRY